MQGRLFHVVETTEPYDSETVDHGLIQRQAAAAEHIVAADILQRNWDCSVAAARLRYDLIADVGGLRRIQVKTCLFPTLQGGVRLYYKFGCGAATSASRRSDGRLNNYQNDVDLLALLAFDIKKIIYVLPSKVETQKLYLHATDFTDERANISWAEALRDWGVL